MTKDTRLTLQPRDQALFITIGQHETIIREHLRALFWPDATDDQTMYRRLVKLVKAGYLVRYDYRPTPQTRTSRYQLTAKALTTLTAETGDTLFSGTMIDREIDQAIWGMRARLALIAKGLRVTGWIAERRLQAEQHRQISTNQPLSRVATADQIADGQIIILDPATGQEVTVEVEIDAGNYWGKMLEEKIQGYIGRKVLWVTTREHAPRVRVVATPNIEVMAL